MRDSLISCVNWSVTIGLLLLFSCEMLDGGDKDDDGDEVELLPQTSSRVIARFPERGQLHVDSGIDVWIELTDSSDVKGDIFASLSEYDYDDSVVVTYSGMEPSPRRILQMNTLREGNKVRFVADSRNSSGGSIFEPTGVLNGYQYAVHVYADDDDMAFYWTFATKPETSTFTFSDTLVVWPEHNAIDAEGMDVYIKLVARSDDQGGDTGTTGPGDPADYWTKATFSYDPGPENCSNCEHYQAVFSMDGIGRGDYTIWAFIDHNKNAPGDGNAIPDNGDYYKVVDFGFYSQPKIEEWSHLLVELQWEVYQ